MTDAATMSPDELRQCLLCIDLSQRALGRHIGMGEGNVRARANGKREMEPEITAWLRDLQALSEKGPFPTFEEWSAPGPWATEAEQDALFNRLAALNWSIEEFSRHLRIERPTWDESEIVPQGGALIEELLRVHGWDISDMAARFDLAREDPDIERYAGLYGELDGREVSRIHLARMDRIKAVQRRAAELPKQMARWIEQRLALHRMTRAQGPIPASVLRWLDSRIALYTTWPAGFAPDELQAAKDRAPARPADDDLIDPLTGGSLA